MKNTASLPAANGSGLLCAALLARWACLQGQSPSGLQWPRTAQTARSRCISAVAQLKPALYQPAVHAHKHMLLQCTNIDQYTPLHQVLHKHDKHTWHLRAQTHGGCRLLEAAGNNKVKHATAQPEAAVSCQAGTGLEAYRLGVTLHA